MREFQFFESIIEKMNFVKFVKINEKSNDRTPSQKCYKKWNGTSTSMEAGIWMVLKTP
jgi:hypothetical protein